MIYAGDYNNKHLVIHSHFIAFCLKFGVHLLAAWAKGNIMENIRTWFPKIAVSAGCNHEQELRVSIYRGKICAVRCIDSSWRESRGRNQRGML